MIRNKEPRSKESLGDRVGDWTRDNIEGQSSDQRSLCLTNIPKFYHLLTAMKMSGVYVEWHLTIEELGLKVLPPEEFVRERVSYPRLVRHTQV